MAVILFVIVMAMVAAPAYGLYCWGTWLKMPERVLARESSRLAKEAALAAKSGNYSEQARLDDARDAILSRIKGAPHKFEGTKFDNYTDHHYQELTK